MRTPWQERNWNKVPTFVRGTNLAAQTEFDDLPLDTIHSLYNFGDLTDKGKEAVRIKLIEEQGGICDICKQPFTDILKPSLDHDHTTNKIRGVLCTTCNLGLGSFRDSVLRLDYAIAYLLKHCVVKSNA